MGDILDLPTTPGPRCAECKIPMTSTTAEGREDGLYCDKCLTALVDAGPARRMDKPLPCPMCNAETEHWWSYCAMCGYHIASGLLSSQERPKS